MLSKMGGRMMHYYSDDLTELLLDDILGEIAIDLQKIESKQKDKIVVNESKALAENIMQHINDFQSEQHLVEMRWTNQELQKMKNEGKPKIDLVDHKRDLMYNIDKMQQPKSIKLGDDDELHEISTSQAYVNPFDEAANQIGLSLNSQQILENHRIDEQAKKQDMDQIQLVGDQKEISAHNSLQRKYQCTLTATQKEKIAYNRSKYESFLKLHNNTASKEVWKIYDHIANELMKEQMNNVLDQMVAKDLDRFVEQVIVDEF